MYDYGCGSRHWYMDKRWRARRAHQLKIEPLCRYCSAEGRTTAATVVDHVEPHRGDVNKFLLGAVQSLCEPCHNKRKQQIERRGFYDGVGVDGLPLDPNHPAYR